MQREGTSDDAARSSNASHRRSDDRASAPGRVQLRRVRGWRLPPDTVQVDRATRWGNPFRCDDPADAVAAFRAWLAGDGESLVRIAGTARGFAVVGNNGPKEGGT